MQRREFLAATALSPMLLKAASGSAQIKVLFDTDIGSDIDDAVGLAYLLSEPKCQLLGVTTVSGQPHERAKLVSALCIAAGKEIPVYPGAAQPLVIPQKQPKVPQAARLNAWEHQKNFPKDGAIAFMRSVIRANPGEVTLLAVGPLTNIALLFMSDPEIPALLKELVIMGGKYSDYPTPWGPTEWNAIVDPHAAGIVFRQKGLDIRAFGLDITWRISMTPEEVSTRFENSPLLRIVLDWSKVWFRERDLLHFHDPLAAVALFDPGVCSYKAGKIEVELENREFLGVTYFEQSKGSQIRVATDIDPSRFFQKYFSVF